jgi:hypothetical protein
MSQLHTYLCELQPQATSKLEDHHLSNTLDYLIVSFLTLKGSRVGTGYVRLFARIPSLNSLFSFTFPVSSLSARIGA